MSVGCVVCRKRAEAAPRRRAAFNHGSEEHGLTVNLKLGFDAWLVQEVGWLAGCWGWVAAGWRRAGGCSSRTLDSDRGVLWVAGTSGGSLQCPRTSRPL